jgi:hypothetical protein
LRHHAKVDLQLEKTGGRIAVVLHTFDDSVVAAIKKIPGREYDDRRRRWTIPETKFMVGPSYTCRP